MSAHGVRCTNVSITGVLSDARGIAAAVKRASPETLVSQSCAVAQAKFSR